MPEIMVIDRAPELGEVWAVLYPSREEVALGLGWSLTFVAQPCGDEPYPDAYEGEVVLDHPVYGKVIVQSIDCDYYLQKQETEDDDA
jgi:hypothetical protein